MLFCIHNKIKIVYILKKKNIIVFVEVVLQILKENLCQANAYPIDVYSCRIEEAMLLLDSNYWLKTFKLYRFWSVYILPFSFYLWWHDQVQRISIKCLKDNIVLKIDILRLNSWSCINSMLPLPIPHMNIGLSYWSFLLNSIIKQKAFSLISTVLLLSFLLPFFTGAWC